MKKSLVIVYSMLALVLVIAFFVGGVDLILKGLVISGRTGTSSALMLLASFLLIGQLNILLTGDVIEKWLERFKGVKAIVVSAIAGGLFPGGPYIYYPFILSFKDKNMPMYVFVSFLFGKQIYDFSRLPMEVSFLNPRITVIRFLITLPIPIILGLLVKRVLGSDKTLKDYLEEGESSGSNNNNS